MTHINCYSMLTGEVYSPNTWSIPIWCLLIMHCWLPLDTWYWCIIYEPTKNGDIYLVIYIGIFKWTWQINYDTDYRKKKLISFSPYKSNNYRHKSPILYVLRKYQVKSLQYQGVILCNVKRYLASHFEQITSFDFFFIKVQNPASTLRT